VAPKVAGSSPVGHATSLPGERHGAVPSGTEIATWSVPDIVWDRLDDRHVGLAAPDGLGGARPTLSVEGVDVLVMESLAG
jgi:hypothetical protein